MNHWEDMPWRLLAAVVRQMPADRREWGKAMLAELAQVEGAAGRWSFAIGCLRVALFPPGKFEVFPVTMFKSMLPTLGIGAVVGFALLQPEISGAGLAWGFLIYGMGVLVIPTALFGNVIVLGVVIWAVFRRAWGSGPWPRSAWLRRAGRLVIELVFGLLNPVLYLSVLITTFPLRPAGSEWWLGPLTAAAWILLGAVWLARICGATFDPRARFVRVSLRVLLWASLACLLAFTLKDSLILVKTAGKEGPLHTLILMFLRFCPLYLIPALLLWDYLRSIDEVLRNGEEPGARAGNFFLLPDRASRVAAFVTAGIALATFVLAAHRRSEGNVRALVADHRVTIQAAANRYAVDPRLIGAIIFVTHRDQLSPFRDAIERLIIHAWGVSLQLHGPGNERREELGSAENKLLNIALDISVGLTQIKPRTAQTASVLAMGHAPENMPEADFHEYRNAEPVGTGWPESVTRQLEMMSPIAVPAARRMVAAMLLNPEKNIETCAMILALYQEQWEATNRDWSIRKRPDILATLYQIGFARSMPHGAPRSNEFGERVRQVSGQAWLGELFEN
jgi:hypothetical protein